MRNMGILAVVVVLSTATLVAGGCAGAPVGRSGTAGSTSTISTATVSSATRVAGVASTPSMGPATTGPAGHGNMRMDETSFDVAFIDSMIEHHKGAILMAQEAQRESQRPEIKSMVGAIIRDQQKEVELMQRWRTDWYPKVAPTAGMGMAMGDMQLSPDTSRPFDKRFLTAMISHHEGAVAMAKEAQARAEHSEIRQLAGAIIAAQEAEIAQMQAWDRLWFGE